MTALYIAMRKDLHDLNPGKAMAQAAHAQAEFEKYYLGLSMADNQDFMDEMNEWRNGSPASIFEKSAEPYFGPTIVVEMTLSQLEFYNGIIDHCGLVVDPTYPYKNYYGETFTESVVTCGWFFPVKLGSKEIARDWKLHP